MATLDRQQAFSGTKEAAPALRLDAARLETYLAAQVAGFAGPLTVKQFKGGQSNPTYLLETPARRYVLRRKPPGKLLPSAHAVDREYRVISALHAQSFPVAEPLALLRGRERRRHAVLRDGLRRRPRVLGAADAGLQPGRARRGLRRHERRRSRALHSVRSGGDRPRRFRPRRKLCRAPGRALVEAVPRLGNRKDRRHGAADRMAAPAHSAERAAAPGAWRLPARQSDRRDDRARKSSPCSTGNCPRSAIRSPTSPIT